MEKVQVGPRDASDPFPGNPWKPGYFNGVLGNLPPSEIDKVRKLLTAPNPYQTISETFAAPTEEELIASSSILAARPDLKSLSYAPQIALEEYAHYITQTYYFEVFGFQILGDLSCHLPSLTHFHTIAAQTLDEIHHIQAYLYLRSHLPTDSPVSPLLPKYFEDIVQTGSVVEKAVKGMLVLESLAIGLFSARIQFYRTGPTHVVDNLALKEEVQHQSQNLILLGDLIRQGLTTYKEVVDIARSMISEMSFESLPIYVAEKFGIDLNRDAQKQMILAGLPAVQTRITRGALRNALTQLQKC